mgnify:CR=1 FL=1
MKDLLTVPWQLTRDRQIAGRVVRSKDRAAWLSVLHYRAHLAKELRNRREGEVSFLYHPRLRGSRDDRQGQGSDISRIHLGDQPPRFSSVLLASRHAAGPEQDVELVAQSIYCVSRSEPRLPFEIDDASRPETDFDKEDTTYVRVGQDTRLNHRVIDLRTPANQAIFRIQSAVCELFRDALRAQDFVEIHTPKLIGGASEGGASYCLPDCLRGRADDGSMMIACDVCDGWYHTGCLAKYMSAPQADDDAEAQPERRRSRARLCSDNVVRDDAQVLGIPVLRDQSTFF